MSAKPEVDIFRLLAREADAAVRGWEGLASQHELLAAECRKRALQWMDKAERFESQADELERVP